MASWQYRQSFYCAGYRVGYIASIFFLALFCASAAGFSQLSPAAASETKSAKETICIENDNWRSAPVRDHVMAYLKLHPTDADVLGIAGRNASSMGRNAESKIYYERAVRAQADNARNLAGLGYACIIDKDYAHALTLTRKAVELDQIDPINFRLNLSAYKNLQALLSKARDSRGAGQAEALLAEQELWEKARSLRESGALDKSMAILNALIKQDPKFACAYLLRGVLYNNRGDHGHAVRDYQTCIDLKPNFTTPYYLQGDSYFEMGKKDKALESWRRVLSVHSPTFAGIIAFEFTALTGRFREHFEPKDQNLVNKADIYFLCAGAEADQRRYMDAIKDYGLCIQADPGEYKAYFERARLGKKINQKVDVADLNKAIQLNPTYIDALLERAKYYESQNQGAQAIADCTKVIDINQADFGSYILRADLYLRTRDYDKALADYNHAIELTPSDDDPYVGRARVYTALKRYDEALADYKKAVKLDKQNASILADAIKNVQKLKQQKH